MKPGDFGVGVLEFFSILIPGFLVTIVVAYERELFPADLEVDTLVWVLLAVTSYIVGHIRFAVATVLDVIYDHTKPYYLHRDLLHVTPRRTRLATDRAETAEVVFAEEHAGAFVHRLVIEPAKFPSAAVVEQRAWHRGVRDDIPIVSCECAKTGMKAVFDRSRP